MNDRKTLKASSPQVTPPGGAGPACLVVVYGGELGKRYALGAGGLVVGRDESCAIAIDLPTISRSHARFFEREGESWVEDLGSTNGTLVNDREAKGAVRLRNGDLVTAGGAILKFLEGGNVEALYHDELYRLTVCDGLTGVANKRRFLDVLEKEVPRARRHDHPLALVMVDVDHFKKVNDEHGHLAGDQVLRGIADVLLRTARHEELVARYGGEEFAVVLAETDLGGAAEFAGRLRAAVEAARFGFDGEPLAVTVSLGVGALREGESAIDLVGRSDAALYAAKRAGRNRVVVAGG